MSNTDRHPECHMRTALGNCDPIGGFCTSVNESICEALHKVSRPQGEWIYIDEPIIGNPYGRYKCSKCNLEEPFESDFCPNCGARMKGASDAV